MPKFAQNSGVMPIVSRMLSGTVPSEEDVAMVLASDLLAPFTFTLSGFISAHFSTPSQSPCSTISQTDGKAVVSIMTLLPWTLTTRSFMCGGNRISSSFGKAENCLMLAGAYPLCSAGSCGHTISNCTFPLKPLEVEVDVKEGQTYSWSTT